MSQDRRLLEAMTEAQTQWFKHRDPAMIFDGLLQVLLSVTESEFGFIGEVLRDPDGNPYLKEHAITNIAWNEETRRFYEEHAPEGLEFRNLKTLFGAVMVTGEPVISNDPSKDPRRGGLPEGHPPLNSFLGIPIYAGGEMVGMSGIANRPGGYDDELVEFLHPFTSMCGNLIHAFRTRRDRDRMLTRFEEERVRLKAILDGAVDAIITVNSDGMIESANPSVEKIFGYTPEELLGRNVNLLMPEPNRHLHDGYIRRYLETGQAAVIGIGREAEGIRKDGSIVPIELTIAEVALPDRTLFTGILRDISKRRAAERALRESEERLAMAIRGGDLGMWDWDITTGQLVKNDRLATMLGYDPSEIGPTAEAWMDLVHPDDMVSVRERFLAHISGESQYYCEELRMRKKGGGCRWVTVSGGIFVRDPKGKPLRAVGIQRDVTRRKEAEEAAREALEAIRKGNEDLLAMLNLLRIGTVALQENGAVSFMSEFCERIEGVDRAGSIGKIWEEVLPFDPLSQEKIRESMKQKESDRHRLSLH
ncbi:MAG TPA: PAS domain S-box protein, partial [Candidatus Deferrimicrobiaceae bacterium]|nr:PAS domain S-box protein [Candidatus Deferrimicrobiaceae bacterium]